jgi:hypothetical protein
MSALIAALRATGLARRTIGCRLPVRTCRAFAAIASNCLSASNEPLQRVSAFLAASLPRNVATQRRLVPSEAILRRRQACRLVQRHATFATRRIPRWEHDTLLEAERTEPSKQAMRHHRVQAANGGDRGLRPNRFWLLTAFQRRLFLHGQDSWRIWHYRDGTRGFPCLETLAREERQAPLSIESCRHSQWFDEGGDS